jgi:hypothetical protein
MDERSLGRGHAVSRRSAFRKVAGAAAVGVAGGAVLADGFGTPAAAVTTAEPGALAPAVVVLTDAETIAVDASAGNDFRVTLGGSRTMGTPSNPSDGQKIIFQLTQGTAGPATITWASGYEFSTGLPQPTLSTAAGQTDLLGFIYNAAKAKWLCAAFVQGYASTAAPPPPPGTYRLFPAASGPSSPVPYSGSFSAGVLFEVTAGGTWLEGFWWWVCPSGQSTAAQTFALWEAYNAGLGTLIPAATVTSGPLAAGQWNYVALPTPVPLAIGACYNATTAFAGGFPATDGQFGAGDSYSAGIVNGPLTAFSDQAGTRPAPFSMPQGVFGTGSTDPTAQMPSDGSNSANFWMDVQVTTTAPSGTPYRLWPDYPTLPGSANGSAPYTLATEFRLAQACSLDRLWFYSPPGATLLPGRCAIWDVSSQAVVSGTDNAAPSWSGAAGSGWVSCSYTGISLPAGDYKAAVFSGGGGYWFQATPGYWGAAGPAGQDIVTGPLTAPGVADATSPGQATYNTGTWAYPADYGAGGDGENYWVDIEVRPGLCVIRRSSWPRWPTRSPRRRPPPRRPRSRRPRSRPPW